MRKMNDFSIIYKFRCKNIIKEGNYYSVTLFDWKDQYLERGYIGEYSFKARNKEELKDKILKFFREKQR